MGGGGSLTAFRPFPRSENHEKGEYPHAEAARLRFPPFSPFSEPGLAHNADQHRAACLKEGTVIASEFFRVYKNVWRRTLAEL